MEYLVTMTTQVPGDASESDVTQMREREAARSRLLAADALLERLWRPPLGPGEWRSIGLFAADTAEHLEQTLSSMPLRAWRSDEVVPLGDHPNDPGRDRVDVELDQLEYLTTFVATVPAGLSHDEQTATVAGEARRTAQLASQGHLLRLWTLPGQGRALGLWQAPGQAQLKSYLGSLPMIDWLAVDIVPLTRHPNDPVASRTPVSGRS